jgi:uncharacterized membrane protein
MLKPPLNRPFLIVGIATGAALYYALAPWMPRAIGRALIGWDGCIVTLLALTYALIVRPGGTETQKRIVALKGKGTSLLTFAILASVAAIVGLASEAATLRIRHGAVFAIVLTITTIVLSWLLIQVVFALRYAHEYFLAKKGEEHDGGLNFVQPGEPDFWDFFHFSVVLGAAAQTADIVFTSRRMRRIGTMHTLVAFGFNTAILATLINVLLNAMPGN